MFDNPSITVVSEEQRTWLLRSQDTKSPLWTRVYATAEYLARDSGHAVIGNLDTLHTIMLDASRGDTVLLRAIKKCVQEGVLEHGSDHRCLLLPDALMYDNACMVHNRRSTG